MKMEKGLTFEQKKVVTTTDTALSMGSGALEVFATPAMVAFMENTATKVVEQCLAEGETSVGTAIDVKHLRASAVGATLSCRATLVEVDGRRLDFEIVVVDEQNNVVGEACHARFVVNAERFLSKLNG